MKSVDDLMDGMAMAVENAFLVLILFSKAYKDSPNTRSEAQYAYHMKKPLLFLRVQPAYRPDGWLGIMLGARIYLDFSGKYPFEKKFEELLLSVNKAAIREPERVDKGITKATVSTSTTSATDPTSTKDTDEAVCIWNPNLQTKPHRANAYYINTAYRNSCDQYVPHCLGVFETRCLLHFTVAIAVTVNTACLGLSRGQILSP
ncbi:hypothetical protein FBUS_11742 [Fasciolopsis buskii]|uniref:TIR domain-containing protein n=1 Tax=Fasciolopsis buskii TaxID=27845 RepID=A0A8E0VKP6_9TREM|nr:hypothetical protein FBUS_11742 [Fasciolopsis buski]